MIKTDKMLLIEARAGKDVREVLAEAYEATGNLAGAADWITRAYEIPMTFGLVSDWVSAAEGRIRKTLEFKDYTPGFEDEPEPVEASR